MNSRIAAIVLAAGRGTRLNSIGKNKVLLPLAGKPMIGYTMAVLQKLKINPILVVVGFRGDKVKAYLGGSYTYVHQGQLLGTGHAVKKALPHLPSEIRYVVVLYGDHSAFYRPEILENLIRRHHDTAADITLLTVTRQNPTGYGRIVRDGGGNVVGIREEKNASEDEKKITEINSGTYCFKTTFLKKFIPKIKKNPVAKEYYLTDLVELAIKYQCHLEAWKINDENVSVGVNTPSELEEADRLMQARINL